MEDKQGGLLDFDSPVVQNLSHIADLILLNLFVLLCCIPIVTIGAAQTALYDVTGRIVRKEEYSLISYWKAFKDNFKIATVLWLIFMIGGLLIAFGVYYYLPIETALGQIALALQCIICFSWMAAFSWAFPLQARFENTIKNTIYNAFYCAVFYIPRTVIMIVLNCFPMVLFFMAPPWFVRAGPLWIFLWFSLAGSINAFLANKPFSVMIDQKAGEKKNQ